MSEEIVRRLLSNNRKNSKFLKESMEHHIDEADDEDINTEDIDNEDEESDELVDDTVNTEDDQEDSGDDDYVDPDGNNEDEVADTNEYVNPLDNVYAVKHTIGDEVLLAYANGTNSKLKGEIDGYDREGFYRIRWSNGLTTNGITDLAIAELISSTKENKCVCGSKNFVTENDSIVCDNCGRVIGESSDVLFMSTPDKKSAKLVRSEVHPVSTSTKPDIKESIKKALR